MTLIRTLDIPRVDSGTDETLGFIRIGPIAASRAATLCGALRRHGVSMALGAAAEVTADWLPAADGQVAIASAFGRGVLGYLVDDEGWEVDNGTLQALTDTVLARNDMLTITGWHRHANGTLVVTRITIMAEPEGTRVTRSQCVTPQDQGGTRQCALHGHDQQ